MYCLSTFYLRSLLVPFWSSRRRDRMVGMMVMPIRICENV